MSREDKCCMNCRAKNPPGGLLQMGSEDWRCTDFDACEMRIEKFRQKARVRT